MNENVCQKMEKAYKTIDHKLYVAIIMSTMQKDRGGC